MMADVIIKRNQNFIRNRMEKHEKQLKALALKLFEINAFKFGDFKIKSGINSPVYFDLRVIVSYPEILDELSNLLVEYLKEQKLSFDHVCGVPYTALPIATLISVKNSTSMLMRRKEAKSYGTKKMIEGKFSADDSCLIIEDVVTSGSSVLETVKDLRNVGIQVTDAVIVVDREQGGAANITENSVRMHSLFTLSYLLNVLKEADKIEEQTVQSVAKYIKEFQIKLGPSGDTPKTAKGLPRTRMTFEDRADLAKSRIAKDLFNLMATKKTNLSIAADLTSTDEILKIAETCGPYICLLKTHADIIENFNSDFVSSLTSLAEKHNFMIMEDRKFADIGNTTALQYSKGLHNISQWAHLITAHSIPGQGIVKALKSVTPNLEKRGVFLLAEMSSEDNFINDQYKEATVKMATESLDVDFIAGIVCQSADCFEFPGLIQLTPGVKINDVADDLGQRYNTPEHVVQEKGADIAVVGRGILKAQNIQKAATLYRDRLWSAYCDRVGVESN